ncbi:MAG: hypothetical protein C5B50_27515 [Verrucomicrobia bacterium]|nr:MAG: hypothetical protein C5B50_27515 [Verrucomicrobiota bacterium]
MNVNSAAPGFPLTVLRWLARILALLMAGMILLFYVGEGFNPFHLTTRELILSVPLFITWIGLWLCLKWDGLGASLVMTGMAAFYLVHFAQTGFGKFPRGWAFPLIALPGLLSLASWLWRRQTARA